MNELIRRGHLVGGGMLSPDKKIFYLNIPKNASTYTTNVLKENNWMFWNITNANVDTVIILLRDPIDRWVSGFATYACSYLLGYGYGSDHFVKDYNSLTERLIFDNIVFDDHTTPQVKFINEIPHGMKREHVCVNRDIINSIGTIANCTLTVGDDIDDNSKETNYDTDQISKFIRRKLNEKLKDKIRDVYADDYQLINNLPNIHGSR